MHCVAPDVDTRNHVAVPVADALTLAGNVGERTAAEAAPENGEPSVNVASTVVAVPPVAGCVPA